MKRNIGLVVLLVSAFMLMGFKGRGNNNNSGRNNNTRNNSYVHITDTTKYDVSEKHIEDLEFMLQEEKLARDVYITLYQTWNLRTFNNISQSEQQHMNSVSEILAKYDKNVEYNDAIGKFSSTEFTQLFNNLVSEGKNSLNDAVKVGIKIEELDIADLKERKIGATPDIDFLYTNLIKGSENHLSAFKRQL